jgi:two-component system, LytTR family, sensor kinase
MITTDVSPNACPTDRSAKADNRRRWMWIWIGSLAVGVFLTIWSTVNEALWMQSHGDVIHWGSLIAYRTVEELTCVACYPVCFWLVDHFPIDHVERWRNAAILLVAIYLVAALKYLVFLPLFLLVWTHAATIGGVLGNISETAFTFVGAIGIAHAVRFYHEARERERTALQLRQRLSQAQLEALKSQLQPHFLFNALNGVTALMHWDVAAADEMLTQLADLLRETLRYPGSHEIPLTEELALLDRYLGVMRVRFHDRLTVRCDIEPAAGDALVPHFLLQPLVENALEHGIAQRPGPGCVDITARRDGTTLRITVVDDGPGLAGDLASGRTNGNGNGVGLTNARARLAELYGDDQTLTLEPVSAAGGARATVTLPYHVRAGAP